MSGLGTLEGALAPGNVSIFILVSNPKSQIRKISKRYKGSFLKDSI
jgi:hypothetical protein